jgi:hypothetical protein
MIKTIKGDGSYLGLIDVNTYSTYVGPDWASIPRLLEPHFIDEMQKYTGLFWDTNLESDWVVDLRIGLTEEQGFREITGSIRVKSGKLALFEYDSLSMMAQFEKYTVETELKDNFIELENGIYTVRIVQLENPEEVFPDGKATDFLIEFEKTDVLLPAWDTVLWSIL